MSSQEPNRLISTAEAAVILHVTTRSIQRWAREGLIPSLGKLTGKTGSYVFAPEAIEAAQRDGVERDGLLVLQPARAQVDA